MSSLHINIFSFILLQLSSCFGAQFFAIIVMLISQLVYMYLVHHFTWTWWQKLIHGNMQKLKHPNINDLFIVTSSFKSTWQGGKTTYWFILGWKVNISKDHNVHHQCVLQNYFTKFPIHKNRLFCCWYHMWWPLFL